MKKFYKLKEKGKISGVCAGLADKFNIDVTLLRIITFILCWFDGIGLVLYILLACLLPEKDEIDN